MGYELRSIRRMVLLVGCLVLLSLLMGWYIAHRIDSVDSRLDRIDRCLVHIDAHYQAPIGTPEVPCQ